MQHHEFLRQQERGQRRTVADAVDVLDREGGFESTDFAEIQIGLLSLPSRDKVGLVNVLFDSHTRGKTFVVSLPTAAGFDAKCKGENDARKFNISELDGAQVDSNGIVRLPGGMVIRAVEVLPAELPLNPSDLDWRIVHHVIAIAGAEDKCYRSLYHQVKSKCSEVSEEMFPGKRIDCSTLGDLILPSLKELAWKIGKKDPTLKLSRQKIADALRKFGMRRRP